MSIRNISRQTFNNNLSFGNSKVINTINHNINLSNNKSDVLRQLSSQMTSLVR